MEEWHKRMVTPADRAEKSSAEIEKRLDKLNDDLQDYRNEAQKEAHRANAVGIIALLVGFATLIVSIMDLLK